MREHSGAIDTSNLHVFHLRAISINFRAIDVGLAFAATLERRVRSCDSSTYMSEMIGRRIGLGRLRTSKSKDDRDHLTYPWVIAAGQQPEGSKVTPLKKAAFLARTEQESCGICSETVSGGNPQF